MQDCSLAVYTQDVGLSFKAQCFPTPDMLMVWNTLSCHVCNVYLGKARRFRIRTSHERLRSLPSLSDVVNELNGIPACLSEGARSMQTAPRILCSPFSVCYLLFMAPVQWFPPLTLTSSTLLRSQQMKTHRFWSVLSLFMLVPQH